MAFQIKWLLILLLTITLSASGQNNQPKQDDGVRCVKWRGAGDGFNQKVTCLLWVKKDCSQRLHKDICRLER